MFGERLKLSRKNKKMTLDQLAEEYNKKFDGGLSKGTLSKYEHGKQEPMVSTVGNLASILDVSVDFLLYGEVLPDTKREDAITDIFKRLKDDDKFFQVVEKLSNLNDNQLNAIDTIISTFQQN